MVGVTKVQRGNADYWLRAVAEGGEDYYTKPGEEPGQWVGDLADQLGLSGEVDGDEYMAVLEGRHPASCEQLLTRQPTRFYMRPDGTERRAEPILAYDVRFSAPKSVSLLYAFGDEETKARVLAILEESVREGLAHLSDNACYVRREEGGRTWIESGNGFIGVAFRHRMSRAGDPALHVHVLVSNLTQAEDGKWYSLFNPKGASPLFVHAKSAGVVFQAVMRAAFLRDMGLEFGEVRNGYADLEGFTPEMIDAFSSRRREVLEWLAERGVSSAEAAQVAAYRTRPGKDFSVDVDRRTVEWIEQGRPLGLTPESVAKLVGAGRRREPEAVADRAIDAAVAALEKHWSYFDRRHLLWAIADQLPQGSSRGSLESAAQRAIDSDRVVKVKGVEEEPFTTPRIAAAEREVIEGALAGLEAGAATVAPGILADALARHPYLGDDQREMVARLLEGGERVVPIAAWPGTGKTTALVPAREAWEAAGHVVIGVAVARTASGELADAGVPATSIAALLYRVQDWRSRGTGLPMGTVLLVDEASVASSFDLAALYAVVAECEGKLVTIGDPRQIGAVGPGGLFGHLVRVVEPSTLTEIRRQHRPEDRELVALMHEGRGSEALDLLRTEGRLIVGENLAATLDGLLLDWHRDFAAGADAVMIARRNREVDWLNEAARELRAAEGALGRAEVIVGERPFAVGDRVQTRLNGRGVDNRERWEVTGIDATARTIRLQRIGGDEREVVLGPEYLDKATPAGTPSLQHAYAITTFGSQGKTFDRAYPLLDPDAGMEEQLVAMSRGREVANAYMVVASEFADPEIGPARRELSDALHDVRSSMEREGADFAAMEVVARLKVEGLSAGKLGERRAQLAEALAGLRDPDRSEQQREAVERNERTLASLRERREVLETMAQPPRGELARVREAEGVAAERLDGRRAEMEKATAEATPASPSREAELRLEAALVERQVERRALAEVAVARLGESELLNRALGPFPEDAERAAAWGAAAHTIASYHFRHGITEAEPALGAVPGDPLVREEFDLASEQMAAAFEVLQQPELEVQLDLDLSDLSDVGG
jgi:conjugative relaxase-like TrwC/TraI family protein